MSKVKYCDTGQHYVDKLWRARTRSTPSACQRCDKGKPAKVEDKAQEVADQKELNKFYQDVSLLTPKLCENCKQPLQAFTPMLKRCVAAHILPKASFESVKVNKANIMFLGVTCGCHPRWDNGNAESRKKMLCYSIALERFQDFYPELNNHEQNQAEKYLGINN